VGFIIARLDLLAFATTFDPDKQTGEVAINTSLFDGRKFKKALVAMRDAFKTGLCVSDLVAVASEGEKLGDVVVPPGKKGLATLCSVTINGVLLKAGIPTVSRFGGVLEIRGSKPRRFVAIINYNGTSLDPSEQYIRATMTSVGNIVRTGSGNILANFREIPAPCRQLAEETIAKLKSSGIGGVCVLGRPSEPVCQIPVDLNRVGIVMLGGLNPVAAATEAGIEAENVGESGTLDFQQLTSFWKL
jgi:repressor of nif and glnA expression